MTAQASSRKTPAWAVAILALLALAVQALVPPGFMLATGPDAGPAVVICTGHGPLTLPGRQDRQAPRKQKASGVCAFAGHDAPAMPAAASPILGAAWTAPTASTARASASVFIGRGGAAPPPARGPPALLV